MWVGWYNHRRLHSKLGDRPLVEFEHLWQLQAVVSADLEEQPFGHAPLDSGGVCTDLSTRSHEKRETLLDYSVTELATK
jgi:hypothetical protein